MIGWTIECRVHKTSSARKVTHPSTILSLYRLTLKLIWVWVKAMGLSHPMYLTNKLCYPWKHNVDVH
jgi:hypothetical protein